MVLTDRYTPAQARDALENSVVGGGKTVTPTYTKEDADLVVSEQSEWERADSSNYDVVYLADGETIAITDDYFDLSGTVLIGGRYKDGIEPGTVDVRTSGPGSAAHRGAIRAEGSGSWHLEGIKIDGPSWDPSKASDYQPFELAPATEWPGYEHIDKSSTTRSERDGLRSEVFSRGVNLRTGGVVRNIEARGFTHAAVSTGSRNHTPRVIVARSMLHNNAVPGYGYGINIYNGEVRSEMNYFDACRHTHTGFGYPDLGYTCHGDVFGRNAMLTPVDMHCLSENNSGGLTAGKYLKTINCTFFAKEKFRTPGWYSHSNCPGVGIRGRPADGGEGYLTKDCQFVHANEADALDQRNVPFPTDWTREGNEYGIENWTVEKGAPVNWASGTGSTRPTPSSYPDPVAQRRARAKAVSAGLREITAEASV